MTLLRAINRAITNGPWIGPFRLGYAEGAPPPTPFLFSSDFSVEFA